MKHISREQILDVFRLSDAGRSNEVPFDTRLDFFHLFRDASANENQKFGTRFRRVYQPSFKLDHIAHRGEREFAVYDAVELRSLLRLDLVGSRDLITPSEGLITALHEYFPGSLDNLDLNAVVDASKVSQTSGLPVRVNFNSSGPVDRIASSIGAVPGSKLIAGIILSDNDNVDEVVTKWAKALTRAGATFAFSNVQSADQLREVVTASRALGIRPQVADIAPSISEALGKPGDEGRAAIATTAAILTQAAQHDVSISITADVETIAARKGLYEAAEQAGGFDLGNLRLAGSKLMPAVLSYDGQLQLPKPEIDLTTGFNLQPAVATFEL